ncbi:MAG: neutral/alkaline non-lysosomal ceramidase N-terminal domain-containing protein [Archangium sp.]|nr:neutral/alkaline non-lysosomal ceramidase N-terminal domain-containing protein [Archangium sp.]
MKRRLLITLGVLTAVVLLGWATASVDRCGTWTATPPALTHLARGQGDLQVGAAKRELLPIFPTTVGGYGPRRTTVDSALSPLFARALVLDVGGQRLGVVLLDVLLIPPQLRDAIGKAQAFPTWVIATHTHSGPSGFDPRFASELAALGNYAPADFQVLVDAGREALTAATAAVKPARLEVGQQLVEGVSTPRSGSAVDRRITRVRFDAEAGPVAQLIIAAAHPTLVARRPEGLHPDWPGLLAERLEREQGPITFVLQGAGGNASIDRALLPTPEAAATRLEALVRALPTAAQPAQLDAAWSEVHLGLPRPDARRVVPNALVAAAENALCDDAEDIAVLHALRLGEARFLLVPFEASYAAGLVLEEQSNSTRLISLADGYGGYVETVEAARTGEGEARRQYFAPELLTRLSEAAKLAGEGIR